MVKKFLISIFVITSLFSCSLDDNGPNFILETLPIKDAIVPDEFIFGESHTVTVIYDLPSGCHSFYDLFYQHDGTARIVAINSIVRTDIACTEALIEKEFSFDVIVSQSEDYTFKFWQGTDTNGNDIFDEVIVPVIQ